MSVLSPNDVRFFCVLKNFFRSMNVYHECKHTDRLMFELAKYQETGKYGNELFEAMNNWRQYGNNMKMNTTNINKTQIAGNHYISKAVQPWEAMEAWMSKEAFEGFLRGNVIKYMARYKDKNGVQDLRKARHYLDKLIEIETKE